MKRNKEESAVRRLLKKEGFTLSKQKDQTHAGVDIVAMKAGEVLLIEVKKAYLHNRAWQVDKVSRTQQVVCNMIAIVSPKAISIQPMKEHLALCSKNGMRYVTEMVKMLELLVK